MGVIMKANSRSHMKYVETEYWKGSPNIDYAEKALASYVKLSNRWNKKLQS